MFWLQSLDTALFRFVNQTMSNPVFDVVLPWFSGNFIFVPALLCVCAWLLWKGGSRGRVFVAMLIVIIGLGDSLIINKIKHAVGRSRPYVALPDVNRPSKQNADDNTATRPSSRPKDADDPPATSRGSNSMPSSHTSNWFAGTVLAFVYYRRSWRFMLPVAFTVGLSRIYVGAHFPSDVLVGAILGAGYAALGVWTLNAVWRRLGRNYFPAWWQVMPSLLHPDVRRPEALAETVPPAKISNEQVEFIRLGYFVIAAVLLFRLGYLASGTIELSKDEAYQWLWSKHLALSYFSKPPAIAFIQFAGTSLWGDTAFGVRFFSPVLAALLSVVLLRFMARTVGSRPAFWMLIITLCTPLMSVGTILMTVDPPLVFCWTMAMIAGWRAAQPDGALRHWVLTGACMGFGFLSKYSAAYQIVCWVIFFALWPPARVHLRRPGPYLALLIVALCTTPVLIWNSQNQWITVHHVADNAGLDNGARRGLTMRYFWEFLGVEMALLNPLFFLGALWAAFAFWPQRRKNPLQLFFFCMGAPVFLGHCLYALYSRIQPNWIAPAMVPMFCLMVAYWHERVRAGARAVKGALAFGVFFGLFAVVLMHDTKLIGKVAGHSLPAERDPLTRVRGWQEAATVVETARNDLEKRESKPAFIIANHYGLTGLFTIYSPEARSAAGAQPLVYARSSKHPENQFYFWPEYRYREHRPGQNAIYVKEHDAYRLESGWIWKWLTGRKVELAAKQSAPSSPSAQLLEEFETVTSLGVVEIKWKGRVSRRLQLFECRNLR